MFFYPPLLWRRLLRSSYGSTFLCLQRLHTPSQHQRLRWFPLQVRVRVAGVHQNESVQRELQPRRGCHDGPGPADEERVSDTQLQITTGPIVRFICHIMPQAVTRFSPTSLCALANPVRFP